MKKIAAYNKFVLITSVALFLANCTRTSPQPVVGADNGEQAADSTLVDPATGQKINPAVDPAIDVVVPKEPNVIMPQDFDLTKISSISKLSSEIKSFIQTSPRKSQEVAIVALFTEQNCLHCIVSARKLIKLVQANEISSQKCKVMIFHDTKGIGSAALKSFSDEVGVNSAEFIYTVTGQGIDNSALPAAFQKVKPAGAYAANLVWTPLGTVTITKDSAGKGVTKEYFEELASYCK